MWPSLQLPSAHLKVQWWKMYPLCQDLRLLYTWLLRLRQVQMITSKPLPTCATRSCQHTDMLTLNPLGGLAIPETTSDPKYYCS